MNEYQVNSGYLAMTVVAIVLQIALPVVFVVVAKPRLGVGWRYFWYGALIFTLFQTVTRVPVIAVIQVLFGQQLQASRTLQFAWVAVLVLTAGLFEEVGRFIGYKWLMGREAKTWAKGVMYGLGHGGIESMALVAGLSLLGLVNFLLWPMIAPELPSAQQGLIAAQVAAVNTQPFWLPLVGIYERVWAIVVHVAFSVLVLQVFQRKSLSWLWIAVAAHCALDAVAFVSLLGLGTITTQLISEAWVTVCGVVALWVIARLRDADPAQSGQADSAGGQVASVGMR